MKRMKITAALCVAPALLAASLVSSGTARAQEFGSVSGQFVIEGDAPAPKFIIKGGKLVDGGAEPKDAAVCAEKDLENEGLLVDKETKGIANVFVFLQKAPATIHPDLKKPSKDEVVFDQKGCRFLPHALIVRTDQRVVVKSDDPVTHNTHTYPIRNAGENFSLPPNFRKGVPLQFEAPEPLPIKVGCDIHPWMSAYWLVVDHPYAALTDKEGKFKIEKLPAGEYQFRVWHEKAGWVDSGAKRGFDVTVKDGEAKLDPVKVPLDAFRD